MLGYDVGMAGYYGMIMNNRNKIICNILLSTICNKKNTKRY